uniref:Uncharacterized protein n=1 Tax=Aspergillus fumigatus TaxID=746128 RepID=Q6MYE0_ASPFM|nr:hypothetical protein AfA34E6.010 [Aspergillus fumigatus]
MQALRGLKLCSLLSCMSENCTFNFHLDHQQYIASHQPSTNPLKPNYTEPSGATSKMGLLELIQHLRGEEPTGYTWYVHFPLHGDPLTQSEILHTAVQELRQKKITLWQSRGAAPDKGMLMKVIVADNKAAEVLKAAGTVLERRLQDAKLSLERILQKDNDKRADNYVTKLKSDLAALSMDG